MIDELDKIKTLELFELGVPEYMANGDTFIIEADYANDERIAHYFKFGDLIDILPKTINRFNYLDFGWNWWDERWEAEYHKLEGSWHTSEEFIDAIYKLVVWAIKNNHITF